jgi:DNA-binding response OmpR family regulator
MVTILCIDGDPKVLELHHVLLGGKGYGVLTALDGKTGIALARKHAIDAVVLDFNMPGLNGSQVAQGLMVERPNAAVVIWSGCPADIPECLHWFADAVLQKGDGPESLLAILEKLIQCKKRLRETA